jgi:hypothetical protein
MRDVTLAGLTEDPVSDGMADDTADVGLVLAGCNCYISVRDFAVERDVLCDVELVDAV